MVMNFSAFIFTFIKDTFSYFSLVSMETIILSFPVCTVLCPPSRYCLILNFSCLSLICLGVVFFVFILLWIHRTLASISQCLLSNIGNIWPLISKYFFCCFLALFSFWASNYMFDRVPHIISEVPDALLILLQSFCFWLWAGLEQAVL